MPFYKILGIAELQIKNCFVWTSNFLLEGLKNPTFLHAAFLGLLLQTDMILFRKNLAQGLSLNVL